jgi:hypothetical protein
MQIKDKAFNLFKAHSLCCTSIKSIVEEKFVLNTEQKVNEMFLT